MILKRSTFLIHQNDISSFIVLGPGFGIMNKITTYRAYHEYDLKRWGYDII